MGLGARASDFLEVTACAEHYAALGQNIQCLSSTIRIVQFVVHEWARMVG